MDIWKEIQRLFFENKNDIENSKLRSWAYDSIQGYYKEDKNFIWIIHSLFLSLFNSENRISHFKINIEENETEEKIIIIKGK